MSLQILEWETPPLSNFTTHETRTDRDTEVPKNNVAKDVQLGNVRAGIWSASFAGALNHYTVVTFERASVYQNVFGAIYTMGFIIHSLVTQSLHGSMQRQIGTLLLRNFYEVITVKAAK